MKFPALISFALFWIVLTVAPAAAQGSAQFKACMRTAKTQLAMNMCAGSELTLRTKQMNSIYNQLVSLAAKEPGAAAKVAASQKAWSAYADAYIEALYPASDKQGMYGSIYPMEVALTRGGLIQQHIADLKALLKAYEQRK